MITVAITGGIGSGKSLAGKIISDEGYTVIDTDAISKTLSSKGGEGYRGILNAFGRGILNENGDVNRKALAEIVFGDKASLFRLNQIMHPLIEKRLFEIIEAHKQEKIVFALVPLLFESSMQSRFDKIWLILSDKEIRIKRAANRDNSTETEIKKRIENQINYEKMRSSAHNVLYNNSSEEEFKVQVISAIKTLK